MFMEKLVDFLVSDKKVEVDMVVLIVAMIRAKLSFTGKEFFCQQKTGDQSYLVLPSMVAKILTKRCQLHLEMMMS